jgi:hypothetical protein
VGDGEAFALPPPSWLSSSSKSEISSNFRSLFSLFQDYFSRCLQPLNVRFTSSVQRPCLFTPLWTLEQSSTTLILFSIVDIESLTGMTSRIQEQRETIDKPYQNGRPHTFSEAGPPCGHRTTYFVIAAERLISRMFSGPAISMLAVEKLCRWVKSTSTGKPVLCVVYSVLFMFPSSQDIEGRKIVGTIFVPST